MEHRGACSCDNSTGDGAGVLTSIPHAFYRARLSAESGVELPEFGRYATGILFLDPLNAKEAEEEFEKIIEEQGLRLLTWRDVPVRSEAIGEVARSLEPRMRQAFVVPENNNEPEADFRRKVGRCPEPVLGTGLRLLKPFLKPFQLSIILNSIINYSKINLNHFIPIINYF